MHGYICCTCMSSHASVYICAFMCLCTPFDTPMNMWSAPPPWKSLLTVDPCSSINRFRTLGKRTPSVRRSRGNITPCNLFCMHYLVSCSTPTTLVIRVRLVDRLVHIFFELDRVTPNITKHSEIGAQPVIGRVSLIVCDHHRAFLVTLLCITTLGTAMLLPNPLSP